MEVVYSRLEHGNYPVFRMNDRIEVEWPVIGRKVYPNVRKTLLAVVNNDPDLKKSYTKDLHYSWDRYFRLGKYSRRKEYRTGTLDIFGDRSLSVSAAENSPQDKGIYISATPTKGINLAVKALDVRKLFYAGFARKVIGMGYNPEDVLQEVYRGILVRNKGKCPFDSEKSSFGHYVHMVSGCIVSNYRRKFSRLARNEVFGVTDENGNRQDVACSKLAKETPTDGGGYEVETLKEHLRIEVLSRCAKENVDMERATIVIEMVFEGWKNKEIIQETGYSANWVSKFLKFSRSVMKEVWP